MSNCEPQPSVCCLAVTALVLGSQAHLKVFLFHCVEKHMGAHGLNVDVSCQDAPTNCSVNAFCRHPYLKYKNINYNMINIYSRYLDVYQ